MAERELEVLEQGITAVIPVYNAANFIQNCVQSLLDQTEPPCKIILVDDGSTDNTVELITRVMKFPEGQVIFTGFHKNKGANAARNFGMIGVKTEYSIILDADAMYYPKMLAKMKTVLDENKNIDWVYCNFHREYEDRPADMLMCGDFDSERLKKENYISMCSMFRTKIWKPMDENIKALQDWDFWLGQAQVGRKGKWIREPLFLAYVPKTGVTSRLKNNQEEYKKAYHAVKSKYHDC